MNDEVDREEKVRLLDILAESWIILLVVPVIAALLTFVSFYVLNDPEHQAQAILRLSKENADLVTSARVLDPAIVQSGWLKRYSGHVSTAREGLIASLSVNPVEDASTYRITLKASSLDLTIGTPQAVIVSLIENSAPSVDRREFLELRLTNLERSLEDFQASLTQINSLYDGITTHALQSGAIELGSLGASISSLVSQIATTEEAIWTTKMAMRGSISKSEVFRPPAVTT